MAVIYWREAKHRRIYQPTRFSDDQARFHVYCEECDRVWRSPSSLAAKTLRDSHETKHEAGQVGTKPPPPPTKRKIDGFERKPYTPEDDAIILAAGSYREAAQRTGRPIGGVRRRAQRLRREAAA